MAPKIFGERFYATRKPGWHGIGQTFKKALKPSRAVVQVGLDYEVVKVPLTAHPARGVKVESAHSAILRSPTKDDPKWRELGVAGDKYEVVQNTDLAAVLDPLAKLWPLETMGALHNGKVTFMTLNTGGASVEGDPIDGYFMLLDVKDGGTATKLVYTPVRVECQNTLTTGLRAATVSISVQHIVGVREQLSARVALIAKARAAIDETTEVFRRLATTKVKPSLAEDLFAGVYRVPRTPDDAALVDYTKEDLGDLLFKSVHESMYAHSYYTEQAQALQGAAMECFERMNDAHPKLANSLWHAFNAVVELADFRDGGRDPEASALVGPRSREKVKAFKLAQGMLK